MPNNLNKILLYQIGEAYVEDTIDYEMAPDSIRCPDSLDQWFDSFHISVVKSQRKMKWVKRFNRYGKKVAILLCALLLSSSLLTLTVNAIKEGSLNWKIAPDHQFDRYAFDLEKEKELKFSDTDFLVDIPEEFILKDSSEGPTSRYYSYISDDGNNLIINFDEISEGTSIAIDNENIESHIIDINGHNGLLRFKGDYSIVVWEVDNFFFSIIGRIDRELAIEIAKSVRDNNK